MSPRLRLLRFAFPGVLVLVVLAAWGARSRAEPSDDTAGLPFRRLARIPLPGVEGRIDHLALDASGRRLVVPETATGTEVAHLDTTGDVDESSWTQPETGCIWPAAKDSSTCSP